MKRTILSLLMLAGLHQAQAQCNAIVVDAPSQNFADKRCIGTPLALYAYATGGTNMNYTWYKDGVEITPPSNDNQHDILSLIPSDGGVYTVKITSAECPSGITPPYTYNIQVDTAGPPAAGTQSASTFTPCVGSTNGYGVGLNNPELYDWTWSIPNGWTGSSTTSYITLTVGDTATSVVATASNGCGTRDFGFGFVIPIEGAPTALDTINLHFGQLCAGNEVYLSVNSTPGDNYLWQFPEDWVQTPYPVVGIVTVIVPSSGTVTVKGYNTCSTDTVTYSQFISVSPPLPTPVITQVGNTLQTTAVAASYSWYEYYENYIGDTTIVGPTGNVYTPKVNGTFILYISDANGCTAESDTIQFSSLNVGIGEATNAVYAIYPNPAKNVINIKAENSIDVRITDLQGRLVYTAANVSGVHTIPTSAMSNGIYMVHSGNGKQIQTTKLLIAK
jgi:hypothetical protein